MYSLNCSAIYYNKGSCIVTQNVTPLLRCMFLDQWLFQKCLKTVQTRLDRINTESLLINKGLCHDFSTLKTWLPFQLRGRPNHYLISSHCLYCPELFFFKHWPGLNKKLYHHHIQRNKTAFLANPDYTLFCETIFR